MLKILFEKFYSGRTGFGLLILRLFVGAAFVLHGSGKLNDIAGFSAEYHVPYLMGAAAMLTQLIGGVLLIVGFLTPLAALGITSTVAVAAAFLIQKGEPFINPNGHSWENAAFYTAAGICLALLGAGRYSLDWLFFGRKTAPVSDEITAAAQPALN